MKVLIPRSAYLQLSANRYLRGSRSQKGSLGVAAVILVIPVILVFLTLMVDFTHMNMVKSELQNAVDAAALAGAQSLERDDANVEKHALSILEWNFADGVPLAKNTPGVRVKVKVDRPSSYQLGTVHVIASKEVHHILGTLFGKKSDTIVARASAGPRGQIIGLGPNRAFPLAVSINAVPHIRGLREDALNKRQIGDIMTLYVHAQQVKNASFTSFDRNPMDLSYLEDAIDQSLGVEEVEADFRPPLKVGDTISLNNGIAGQRHLATHDVLNQLVESPVLTMPVFVGDPQFQNKAEIVGFVCGRVTNVTRDRNWGVVDSITLQLIKNAVRAESGELPSTDNIANDMALPRLSPGSVKLLPREFCDERAISFDGDDQESSTDDCKRRMAARAIYLPEKAF